MVRNLIIFVVFLFCIYPLQATATIVTPVIRNDEAALDDEMVMLDYSGECLATEKTLKEKLNDVYHSEVTDTEHLNFMFKDILTKKFGENSALNNVRLWAGHSGYTNFSFTENDHFQTNHTASFTNLGVDGTLKNDTADFRLMLNYSPQSNIPMVNNLFSDVYIGTNKLPHTRLQVGNFRPAAGMEGRVSPYLLPFFNRAQISRTFGSVRKIGGKITGDYDLFDYDMGIYSSETYFTTFFPGTEFDGWINVKPLGKTDGKYGKIKLGTGIQIGKRDADYCVTGSFAEYAYKKLRVNFEWANANGYNGASTNLNKKATGFYTTIGYKITPKLEALVRYDEFNPDKNINSKSREYSAGLSYYIKGSGLKLMLNYIFCQNVSHQNSHKILLGTQFLL